jgi:hypothetical protein
MPSRSLSSDIKVGGAGVTVASSPWPFLVSWFFHPFWIKCRNKKVYWWSFTLLIFTSFSIKM